MPDVEVAAPSAAPEAPASFEIPRSGTPEYAQWRMDGTLPEKTQPKPADSAPADTSKETPSENAPEPESGKSTQESRRKPGAEARIAELTARAKQLERELEEARRPKETPKADPSPAKPAESAIPHTYQDWRKTFKAAEWNQQYMKDHPDATWEDIEDARADHLADVREQFRAYEQQFVQQRQQAEQMHKEALERYPDFDSVGKPVIEELFKPGIAPEILRRINRSKYVADILYTIGGTADSRADFFSKARTEPDAAYDLVVEMERLIGEQFGKGSKSTPEPTAGRNEKGQFTKTDDPPPAKKGPESAPEPPIEVGSRGSGPIDESERALKDAERGDAAAFRRWKEAEDRKELRRRRGE